MWKTIDTRRIKYLSGDAYPELIGHIRECDYAPVLLDPLPQIDSPVAAHADIRYCRLGCDDESPVIAASVEDLHEISGTYPHDVAFNAVCTGRFFIHNLKYTHPRLREAAESLGMILINVKQGYAKCSCIPVDESSIITYDRGIAAACTKHSEHIREISGDTAQKPLSVLLVQPGHVLLRGCSTGFIGGCTGRLGQEIMFNGDLSVHPDGAAIREFIEERGLKVFDIPRKPLADIGSIL